MSKNAKPKANKSKIVCRCNQVERDRIEAAIDRGCTQLGQIYDATSAGVGACGGTCRPQILKMIMNRLK